MNDLFQEAYERYFSEEESAPKVTVGESTIKNDSHSLPTSASRTRMTAKGNVDDIDKLGEILRKLLNTSWGSNWGTLSPETSKGEDAERIIVPQINYAINLREVAKGTSPKPTLTDTIDEVVNGKKTGDSFRIYRQTFDCIVEFNFWDATSKGCRALMNRFEENITTFSGYLKEQGVSEIFFLKEVPAKYSLNYSDGMPMRCLYYFVRLERVKSVRVSIIKDMELKLKAESDPKELSTEQTSDDINKKITYRL